MHPALVGSYANTAPLAAGSISTSVLYALFYETAEGGAARAPKFMPAHRECFTRYNAEGTLRMIGTFGDPQTEGPGDLHERLGRRSVRRRGPLRRQRRRGELASSASGTKSSPATRPPPRTSSSYRDRASLVRVPSSASARLAASRISKTSVAQSPSSRVTSRTAPATIPMICPACVAPDSIATWRVSLRVSSLSSGAIAWKDLRLQPRRVPSLWRRLRGRPRIVAAATFSRRSGRASLTIFRTTLPNCLGSGPVLYGMP